MGFFFWESIGFVCDATEIIELENFVLRSWGDNTYLIPDFFTHTFDTQQKI